MRKSDKKIENKLREVLTDVCEIALKEFTGFEWVTHLVNYNNFPSSLKIICIFDTNDNLTLFKESNNHRKLGTLIQTKLFEIDINLKSINNHFSYDTEENCQKSNSGKWADRLG